MISLSRHIELLLLEYDCVIVPGIGGFIASHAEAQYNSDGDTLFLPPYRTVRFNQQLQTNDGLLVQSYMTTYDASYPAAYLQMEKDIEKVTCELEMIGEYTFEKIGVLRKEINNNLVFTPSEIGILTPSLYGLFSYEIKPLSEVIKEKQVGQALNAASAMTVCANENSNSSNSNSNKNLSKHRYLIDFGISVAAAIVLLFCFSYQALKNTASDTDTVVATFYTTNKTDFTHPVQGNGQAKPAKAKGKANDKTRTAEIVPQKETPVTIPAHQEPKFAIVLASFVNKTNADVFIEELSKQGFSEGRYVKHNNVSRIFYSNYSNKEEAQQALQGFRQQNIAFENAWVLEL